MVRRLTRTATVRSSPVTELHGNVNDEDSADSPGMETDAAELREMETKKRRNEHILLHCCASGSKKKNPSATSFESPFIPMITYNGVGTKFGVWQERGEARRAESGGWVLGEGQPAPLHQLGVYGSAVSSPMRGPGWSSDRRRVFLYSVPSDCLSQHLSRCCIQFAWLGIRFF